MAGKKEVEAVVAAAGAAAAAAEREEEKEAQLPPPPFSRYCANAVEGIIFSDWMEAREREKETASFAFRIFVSSLPQSPLSTKGGKFLRGFPLYSFLFDIALRENDSFSLHFSSVTTSLFRTFSIPNGGINSVHLLGI